MARLALRRTPRAMVFERRRMRQDNAEAIRARRSVNLPDRRRPKATLHSPKQLGPVQGDTNCERGVAKEPA